MSKRGSVTIVDAETNEVFRARDERLTGHFWADDEIVAFIPQIGAMGFALYMLLCYHANNSTSRSFASIGTLAKELSATKPTVRKFLNKLVETGLIRIDKRTTESSNGNEINHSHYYTLRNMKAGVVKDFDQGGKNALPGVVKDFDPNYTKNNKTQEPEKINTMSNPPKSGGSTGIESTVTPEQFLRELESAAGMHPTPRQSGNQPESVAPDPSQSTEGPTPTPVAVPPSPKLTPPPTMPPDIQTFCENAGRAAAREHATAENWEWREYFNVWWKHQTEVIPAGVSKDKATLWYQIAWNETWTELHSTPPPGNKKADETVTSSPASQTAPEPITEPAPTRANSSETHANGNATPVLAPPDGYAWIAVTHTRHLVKADVKTPHPALVCGAEYDGLTSQGPTFDGTVPCSLCLRKVEERKPKVPINEALKDAIAQHVQGIKPKLAGRLTGLLASMAAGVYKRRMGVEKLNAEQYMAVTESIPVFVQWYRQACNGCSLPQSLESFENWYSKFPPEWKPGDPVAQGGINNGTANGASPRNDAGNAGLLEQGQHGKSVYYPGFESKIHRD